TVTTAAPIDLSSLADPNGTNQGGLVADGNTLVVAKRFTASSQPQYFQIVKFGTASIQSFENRFLPNSYAGINWSRGGRGAKQFSFRENQGIFAGFEQGQAVAGFKASG